MVYVFQCFSRAVKDLMCLVITANYTNNTQRKTTITHKTKRGGARNGGKYNVDIFNHSFYEKNWVRAS